MNIFKKIILCWVIIICCIFSMNSNMSHVEAASSVPSIKFDNNGKVVQKGEALQSKTTVLNKLLREYRTVILFLSGMGTLSMILFFILNLIALGNSKGNPQERQKAIHGLIITGVASAGLGSVVLITEMFYFLL